MLIFRYVVYWIIVYCPSYNVICTPFWVISWNAECYHFPFVQYHFQLSPEASLWDFHYNIIYHLMATPPPNSQNIHKKVRSFKISIVMITVSVCLSEFKILDWTFSSSFWRCKKARVRILACIHMSAFSYWGPKFKSLYYYMDQENWWGEKT